MNSFLESEINELKKDNGGHICYIYEEHTMYIETAVSFIVEGIKHDEHVILIDNERNLIQISEQLDSVLSKIQREQFHTINNFDFYWENEDFHPHTILNYFTKKVDSSVPNGKSVRTWGHVEWGDSEILNEKLEEYEKIADCLVHEQGMISVCAYDANKIPVTWKSLLIKSHGVTLTDTEVIESSKLSMGD